ncbi:DNA replication/repair protein RecF [Paraglaciecola chathamensis]|jgi:DNA replication and repair protein RecF|uniref:DNA replication and repair protein RecF n=1 Tax=Paraglaciecola chathamensis S18K6 TaxID=1127672 RepID=A0AAV3UYU3_9ALTE|nr:DNA replication/repair protein RecF [Paraglaciecola chathamensis]AEE20972.1 DNA replication and repair protein RecF [Glaciecola sp. 4H-3-7+YE-5]MDO6841157.1 DNA replication/repair protein RecF [Paraglaciecola chathamensis]GAC09730.1 DNA replication and repair protein RecF [Paraglaciecola chathamensis S18K6]
MKLDSVQIRNLRNLQQVSLNPSHGVNFILGINGSGKSSILEAIHYLGFGRSFRTTKHKHVIQSDQESFTVFCQCTDQESVKRLGISRNINDVVSVSINGVRGNKISELVSQLPVQIFTPQSSDILLGSPKLRRKYIDWCLFHVEHPFLICSNSYTKLLKHNNALCRKHQVGYADPQRIYWTEHLAKYGETLTQFRNTMMERLIPLITSNLEHFLPEFCVEISYYRGWEKGLDLIEALAKASDRDYRNGYISVGPHKADVRFKIDGKPAHEVLSRGQLRMLVAALQLATTQCLMSYTQKTCIFLLDDVGAELDAAKREVFIDKLLESNTQLFVTAIEAHQLEFIDKYQNKKMFHVEHGQVREES